MEEKTLKGTAMRDNLWNSLDNLRVTLGMGEQLTRDEQVNLLDSVDRVVEAYRDMIAIRLCHSHRADMDSTTSDQRWCSICNLNEIDKLQTVIDCVRKLHQPLRATRYGTPYCSECSAFEGHTVVYPCMTTTLLDW